MEQTRSLDNEQPEDEQIGAYAGFKGKVGYTFADSEPWWRERPKAPEGAPNILIMLMDDLGFADIGCFGSEIDTPNIDKMAEEGLRYTNFYVNPMCSPTRASLLTGLNHHAAGVGWVAHADPGFPGYEEEITKNAATAAEILKDNGYATMMVGKWHLSKDSDLSAASCNDSWPVQRGFDHYYGILGPFTNLHMPDRIIRGNDVVDVETYPDGYYFTDDLTDRAIEMVKEQKASNPEQPFFLYFAHCAVHAPLHVKRSDMDKYKDRYQVGWDRIRQERFEKQLGHNIIPAGTPLPPHNDGVKAWSELSDKEKELFARYQAIYAGIIDNVDQNWGRLREALEQIGELDNTLIIFTSDNGASREGGPIGTSTYHDLVVGYPDHFEQDYDKIDLMGGPRSMPHYPEGWAEVSNTPFRLYKQHTHAGGIRAPLIISWNAVIPESGGLRTQYVHVTDILPTLLDLLQLEAPSTYRGQKLKPMNGISFAKSINAKDAPSLHTEQYYESVGHRGYHKEEWEVVTNHQTGTPFSIREWELYNMPEDPTEINNLAEHYPEKVTELANAWEEAAWKNQVFPLDEGWAVKVFQRPPRQRILEKPVTIYPGTPQLDRYRCYSLILLRSYNITCQFSYSHGNRGIILAHGDQAGGYVIYIDNGQVSYVHNAYGVLHSIAGGDLSPGQHQILIEFIAKQERKGTGKLVVDGTPCGDVTVPLFFGVAPFQGICVGSNKRSPVSWEIYEKYGSFPYTGNIDFIRYDPGDPAPDSPFVHIEDIKKMMAKYD